MRTKPREPQRSEPESVQSISFAHRFQGRDDPVPHIDERLKIKALYAVDRVIAPGWRVCAPQHPAGRLYAREDWAATLELFNIGEFVRAVEPLATEEWWKDIRRRVQDEREGQQRGAMFELELAAAFAAAGLEVRLRAPNEPGYDFTLSLPQVGHYRVSVKVLARSDEELEFRRVTEDFRAALLERAPSCGAFHLWLARRLDGSLKADLSGMLSSVSDGIHSRRHEREVFAVEQPGWIAVVDSLGATPMPLDPTALSYTFVASSKQRPQHDDKRFYSKLEEALSNLRAGGPLVENEANIVAIKMPHWASADEAAQLTTWAFEQKGPTLAAIILWKTQLVAGETRNAGEKGPIKPANIGFLIRTHVNPMHPASEALRTGLRYHLPFGMTLDAPPVLSIVVGGKSTPLPPEYLWTRGEHAYRVESKAKGARHALPMPDLGSPGLTSTVTIVHHGAVVTARGPGCPRFDLELL